MIEAVLTKQHRFSELVFCLTAFLCKGFGVPAVWGFQPEERASWGKYKLRKVPVGGSAGWALQPVGFPGLNFYSNSFLSNKSNE